MTLVIFQMSQVNNPKRPNDKEKGALQGAERIGKSEKLEMNVISEHFLAAGKKYFLFFDDIETNKSRRRDLLRQFLRSGY
jgi:hypothetical protein